MDLSKWEVAAGTLRGQNPHKGGGGNSREKDSELVSGDQGLLIFAPNLQSFGMLPKGNLDWTSSVPRPPVGQGQQHLATMQSSQMGQYNRRADTLDVNVRSEEDIDASDDEDAATYALGNDDSLERATQQRSMPNIHDRSITKASSTRKLND